jgi:ABC-2 type transport system ATP-binding protein
MGLQLPGSGSLRVLGLDPVKQPLTVREAVGYVPDVPRFIEWMTLHELMMLVAHYRPSRWNHRRAHHLVATFDLTLGQRVDTMSKGQRAKVALLLALAFEPEVLILDEPTGGLDPLARHNFFESVLREYMDGDQTVFISSHLINEIAGLVDHVGILKNGRLMRSQPTEALQSADIWPYAADRGKSTPPDVRINALDVQCRISLGSRWHHADRS